MRNKALITSVGRKLSLVREFKNAGWIVYGLDSDPEAHALSLCDEKIIGSTWQFQEGVPIYYLPELIAKEDGIDLVVPTRDGELFDMARCLKATRALAPSIQTIEICIDKLKFHEWCKAIGFKSPEVYFVKPRVSKSGKEVECVWQEFVDGEELSIDLFSDFSSNVISIVPRVRSRVVSGESSVTTTVSRPQVMSESKKLAETLGLVGHNVLQCFYKDGEVVWTDVNARFGGASIVGIKAGCKSPEWLLKLVNGEKVEPQIGNYIVGLKGSSYSEWTFED